MKKATTIIILCAALAAAAATLTVRPGLTDAPTFPGAYPGAAVLTGAALVSTNATQSATVKAVYALDGGKAVTNDLVSLTASGGFAETNGLRRCMLPGAAFLVTGAPVTLYYER